MPIMAINRQFADAASGNESHAENEATRFSKDDTRASMSGGMKMLTRIEVPTFTKYFMTALVFTSKKEKGLVSV